MSSESKSTSRRNYEYKSLRGESQNYEDDDEASAHDELDEEEEKKNDSDKLLPLEKPFRREYILRSSVPRPAPYSRQSPQRLYCLMSNIEFRMAGAFTEDTMFF